MKFKNVTRYLKDYKQGNGKVNKDKNKLKMSIFQKKRKFDLKFQIGRAHV